MKQIEHKNISVQRRRKMAMVDLFAKDCADSEGVFVADYSGISVSELANLRSKAKNANCRVRVVKNTIAKRVIAENPKFAPLADQLEGQLIYGSGESAPTVAKIFKEFAIDNENLEIKAGVIEGSLMDESQVKKLAGLPSKEEFYGILACTLNAPIVKFAQTLSGIPAALARVLGAVKESKANNQS